MEPVQLLAITGAALGLAYLIAAAIAYPRSRARARERAAQGQAVVSLNDAILVEGEMTADRMHKLAGICASISRRVFDEDMDFSAESIPRLERIILRGWGDAADAADMQVRDSFGAYLGEVLVRNTRGHWVTSLNDEDPALVFYVSPTDQTVSVSPFMMVRQKFLGMYSFDLAIAFTALDQKLKELGVK